MHKDGHVHRVYGFYRTLPWRSIVRFAMIITTTMLAIVLFGMMLRAINIRYQPCDVDTTYTAVNCIVNRPSVSCSPDNLAQDTCNGHPENRTDAGCTTVVDNVSCPPPHPECQVGRRRIDTNTCLWPPPTLEPGTPCQSACFRQPTGGQAGSYCTSKGTCKGNPALCVGFVNGSDVLKCPSASELFLNSWSKPDLAMLTGGINNDPVTVRSAERIMSAKPVETMLNRGRCSYFSPRLLDARAVGANYEAQWVNYDGTEDDINANGRLRFVLANPSGKPNPVANCTDIARDICRSRINWDDPRSKCLRVGAGCNVGGVGNGRSGRGDLPTPNGRIDVPDGGWIDLPTPVRGNIGVAAAGASGVPKAGMLGNVVAHCYYYFECTNHLPDNLPWIVHEGLENVPDLTPAQAAPSLFSSRFPNANIVFDWAYSRIPSEIYYRASSYIGPSPDHYP